MPANRLKPVPKFNDKLNYQAKKIHGNVIRSIVFSTYECPNCGDLGLAKVSQLCSCSLKLSHSWILHTREMWLMGKILIFNLTQTVNIDSYVERFSNIFNYLADNDLIHYGVLGETFTLPLTTVNMDHRIFLGCYVGSKYNINTLNQKLDNKLFVSEGGVGDSDWTNLPVNYKQSNQGFTFKQQGLCPTCGDSGSWVSMALICRNGHGIFAG